MLSCGWICLWKIVVSDVFVTLGWEVFTTVNDQTGHRMLRKAVSTQRGVVLSCQYQPKKKKNNIPVTQPRVLVFIGFGKEALLR